MTGYFTDAAVFGAGESNETTPLRLAAVTSSSRSTTLTGRSSGRKGWWGGFTQLRRRDQFHFGRFKHRGRVFY